MTDRHEYTEKAKARIDKLSAEIDKKEAQLKEASVDAKQEYRDKLDELRSLRADARTKLNELEQAGDDVWADIKGKADEAWTRLRNASDALMGQPK